MDWPILRFLPEVERRRALAAARRRRFAAREVLFHEGDPGNSLHLIDRGRVAVRVSTPLGDAVTLEILSPGQVVGEMAVLEEGGARGATVVALEKTETLALHRDLFLELREDYPAIDRFLIEVLAARVRRLDSALMEALFVPVERRVLRRLVALTDVYQDAAGDVEISLTQEDLASLAGTSRATTNRALRLAEEAGVLALSRGRIRILDPALLARRAR